MSYAAMVDLCKPRLRRIRLQQDRAALSFATVLDRWQTDSAFRDWFSAQILDTPFPAVRWETPPVTRRTIERDFEFVLHDAPGLVCRADPRPFAEHFHPAATAGGTVTFDNLGRDATLIVPAPLTPAADYAHLSAFLRNAPDSQKHQLWQSVRAALAARISDRPIWLSTAGMGVPWLHVRLDSRPKYYGYEPYRSDHGDEGPG